MTDPEVLERLGMRSGEPVRFRRNGTGRYTRGLVSGVSADGCITLYDIDGAIRNVRPTTVEVRRPGKSGRLRWTVLSDVAITWEQLGLW